MALSDAHLAFLARMIEVFRSSGDPSRARAAFRESWEALKRVSPIMDEREVAHLVDEAIAEVRAR